MKVKATGLQTLPPLVALFARETTPAQGIVRTLVGGVLVGDYITEPGHDELWFGRMILIPELVVNGRGLIGWKLGQILTSGFTNPEWWDKVLYTDPNSDLSEFITNMKGKGE